MRLLLESAREITTKHRLGKLPVTMTHGRRAGSLPGSHLDPFDRMLMAQAMIESLVLASNELAFDARGALRLW
jgi:PIN domain nuclease of toxin-antitoxin system